MLRQLSKEKGNEDAEDFEKTRARIRGLLHMDWRTWCILIGRQPGAAAHCYIAALPARAARAAAERWPPLPQAPGAPHPTAPQPPLPLPAAAAARGHPPAVPPACRSLHAKPPRRMCAAQPLHWLPPPPADAAARQLWPAVPPGRPSPLSCPPRRVSAATRIPGASLCWRAAHASAERTRSEPLPGARRSPPDRGISRATAGRRLPPLPIPPTCCARFPAAAPACHSGHCCCSLPVGALRPAGCTAP